MKLWADFNHAWLALFQKQKDIVEAGQLQPAQNILHAQLISNMGNELVRLCDGIERHGLVDYQYGVWEEQIIKSRHPFPPLIPAHPHPPIQR